MGIFTRSDAGHAPATANNDASRVDKQNVSVTLDQGDTIIEFLPRSDRRSYGLQGA